MLKVYNSATKQREVFIPQAPAPLNMYVCGPTVYNYIHIGNARVFIVFDVIRRYLNSLGYKVKYVQNFTDFDDKLLLAAKEKQIDVLALSQMYIDSYFADMDALGVHRADVHPKASEHIGDMVDAISALLAKGVAYQVNGDVYFRAHTYKGYGQLAHQSLDELMLGSRIPVGDKKEHPLDFALWKSTPSTSFGWQTPFGYGRPGWHIECSVMIKRHLGDTIDFHGGGEDLCFPHHENERVQSEAWLEKPFVRYWLHNAFVVIKGCKMSKSLQNTLDVVSLRKKYDPCVLRYLLLNVHYRRPLNIDDETIEQAKAGLKRLQDAFHHLQLRSKNAVKTADENQQLKDALNQLTADFQQAMNDDFNTSNAISVMFSAMKLTNDFLTKDQLMLQDFDLLNNWWLHHGVAILGLVQSKQELDLSDDISKLIAKREDARKSGDFKLADHIRSSLLKQGIILEDTPQGIRWKRI